MAEDVENVCLFCLQSQEGSEENAYPFESDLRIKLDDPSKNKDAFNLICTLLRIDCATLDWNKCLPLCIKCQNLYQELFHLHLQVKELDRMMKERVHLITTLIWESESNNVDANNRSWSSTGLDAFREKVLSLRSNEDEKCTRSLRKRKSTVTESPTKTVKKKKKSHPPSNLPIKTEPLELESNISDLLEDVATDQLWDDDAGVSLSADFSDPLEDSSTKGTWDHSDSALNELLSLGEGLKVQTRSKRKTEEHRDDTDYIVENEVEPSEESDEGSEYSFRRKTRKRSRKVTRKRKALFKGKRNLRDGKQDSLTCHICKEEVVGRSEFHQHYSDKHPDVARYDCIYCQKHFVRLREVLMHQRTHHENEKNIFKCEVCGKLLSSAKGLTSHKRRVHQIGVVEKVKSEPVSYEQECHLCNVVVSDTRAHYKEEHPEEKKFSCKYCKRHFERLREVLSHQRNKHERIILEDCGSRVTVAILDPKTGEIKETKKCRKRGHPTGIRKTIMYSCHLCEEKDLNTTLLKKHYQEKHPEEKRYSCKFCKKHFTKLRDVVDHQRRHTAEKPYHCEECNKSFASSRRKEVHDEVFHGPEGKKFSCDKCGKAFVLESSLKMHLETHNNTFVVCLTCGGIYRSKGHFLLHNKQKHKGAAKGSDPVQNPSEKFLASLGIQVKGHLKCFICWKPIGGSKRVDQHFKENHPGTNPLICPYEKNGKFCGKSMNLYKNLLGHYYRLHMGGSHKKIQCDKCPRLFFSYNELKNHSRVHLSENEKERYVCQTCGVSFASKYTLREHSKMKHTNDGVGLKYVCELCGKPYSDRKSYARHKICVHDKNFEHKCPHCPKAYALRSELNKHMNSHMKLKPFKCTHCDMRFSYTASRKRHIQSVHQNIKRKKYRNYKSGRGGRSRSLSQTLPEEGDSQITSDTNPHISDDNRDSNSAIQERQDPKNESEAFGFSSGNWGSSSLTQTAPNVWNM